jgi:uncharacterized protein (TIGR02996 family)
VEEGFLAALHVEPCDEATWLALTDWLEEAGQSDRAELVRLQRRLRTLPVMRRSQERSSLEERLIDLLVRGVRPVTPLLVNSVGMSLALVPPGRFRMGSSSEETGRSQDEGPLHEVEITKSFYLGAYPVRQRDYQGLMGSNPGWFSATGSGKSSVDGLDTSDFPVENVTWHEACEFCQKLSDLPAEKAAGRVYRLPTEAEWEYACRAGTSTTFCCGSSLSSQVANIRGNAPYGGAEPASYLGRTCPVGRYPPNAFGLYDMHGNVYDWCSDWFDEDYYKNSPAQDPPGPVSGTRKVLRDASWADRAEACRAANRNRQAPGDRNMHVGFRVVCVVAR